MGKQKVMIVDDSAMNREILTEMIQDEYDIIEFENGKQAITYLQSHPLEASIMLLDIVMPEMDGFQVLSYMNQYHWIDEVPVVMISSESDPKILERAYSLGVSDFISRPFNTAIVRQRVRNTILLYTKQRKLADLVVDQISEKERNTSLLVSVLSHIVEFRNGESGLHVMHINTITTILLEHMVAEGRLDLTPSQIQVIALASSLHDVGKIAIDNAVLNKPGRLTPEEFEVIKTHSAIGASMLQDLPFQDAPLIQYAREICRWHHERYDGRGYPDGLKGDEIPISAQVVSLADVYDALTSPRCYKPAYSHEDSLAMIARGECGAFNPRLLESFYSCADQIRDALHHGDASASVTQQLNLKTISQKLSGHDELSFATSHLLRQLEFEKSRVQFLSEQSGALSFTYFSDPPFLELSPAYARRMDLPTDILQPMEDPAVQERLSRKLLARVRDKLATATRQNPQVQLDCQLSFVDGDRWSRLVLRCLWSSPTEETLSGFMGWVVDLHPRYDRLDQTRHAAVQYTLQKYIGSPCPENWFSLTSKALPGMVQALRFLFDAIRLVDITTHQAYSVTRQGELMPDAHPCFALWGRDVVCDYCLSESVTRERARMSKFEFQGDDVYHVIAIYVEVDGQPRSMEMLTKITPTAIARAGLNQADGFPPHDSRLYIDPLTRVFNRQYYEETLRDAPLTAVAMVDVDNFKEINDQYGHLAGDMVLAAVASAISTSIRSADDVARYGGDEFALVFQSIPADIFRLRLEKIRGVIQELHLDQFPDLHITVSIGGLHGPGVTWHRLHQADLLLSKAKKQKNRVCIMVEAPDESIPTL